MIKWPLQARHQLKQYEGRIKNIEEEHKQVKPWLLKSIRTEVVQTENVVISWFTLKKMWIMKMLAASSRYLNDVYVFLKMKICWC